MSSRDIAYQLFSCNLDTEYQLEHIAVRMHMGHHSAMPYIYSYAQWYSRFLPITAKFKSL